jgi:hypothetical protein
MRRLLFAISLILIATPLFAQDVDLIGAGGIGDLLDIAAPRGAAPARGAAPPRGAAPNAPPVDRLVRLRQIMVEANAPLNKEQETGLTSLINAEVPMMRQALQRKAMQINMEKGGMRQSAPPAPAAAPGAAPQRGPNPAAAMAANITPEDIAPEIIRLNDQLLGKIAAAPMLSPQQQAVVMKIYKDQIKAHGGFEAIKMTLDDAGASFTAEQIAQVRPLFEEQEKAKIQLAKESAGQPPDKAKLDQIQRDTLLKVMRLLTPAQRTAMLAPAKP